MNKALAIPLMFIILLSMISLVNDPSASFVGATEYEERNVWNSTTSRWDTISVPVEEAPVNLSTFDGVMIMLVAAITIAIVAGISVFGSGLSELSQELTMKLAVYGGLWAIFSVIAYDILETLPTYGALLWTGMTIMYAIGFTQSVGTSE